MRTLALVATVLLSVPAFAEKDAGVADAGSSAVMMAPVSIVGDPIVRAATDGGVADVQVDPTAAVGLLKTVFVAVKEGNWWLAAAGLLILVVGLMRKFGKMVHEWLPDNNPLDKIFWFFLDTKVGGWILNWLTAIAGGIGTGMLAGVAVDFSLWKSVLIISTSGTALVELWKDIREWWAARKAKQAAAAGVTPAAPSAPGNPPAVK